LHDSRDPPVVKALPKKDFPKEGPANRIIGFVKIDLQKDHLQVLDPDLMKNLMKHQDTIQDVPTLNEGLLVRVGNPICKQGHPIGVPLGQDPEDHVNDRNRAELADVSRPRDLGDEGDGPEVEAA